MLGDEQWGWLEQELMTKKSTIKVIASGTQSLPPTTKERTPTELCAYDGPGGTFDAANEALGEGTDFAGTRYESWGEVPQERARLLRLVQKSINAGMAKRVIFLSGEQHWGELMAMRIPEDAENGGGAAQVVYEVTASGIDQNWVEDVFNSHRVRVRTADSRGDGFYDKECNFPFVYEGVTYNDCADVFNTGIPVCATQTAFDNSVVGGAWGTCLPAEQELVPRDRQRYSLENKCADNYHFTCSAQANFGTMVVDWNAGTIMLSIRTPHHNSPMASEITVDI
jgi:alkaline phosphatase D